MGVVEGIVGIRPWDDRSLRVYRREGGSVISEEVPFQPWLALADPSLLDADVPTAGQSVLEGNDGLRTLVHFDRWPQVWEAIQRVLSVESARRRQRVASYLDLPDLLFLFDPVEQWLTATGNTFYRGLKPGDLVRMQVAIETASPPGRESRSDRSQDRIRVISATVSDGRKSTFKLRKQDEPSLLTEFLQWFLSIDPDVVEGIDLLSFTLPYLAERCALHAVEPTFGRDGSSLRQSTSPIGKGPWEIPGRSVFDPAESMRHAGPTTQAIVADARKPRKAAAHPSGSQLQRRLHDTRRWSDPWWQSLLALIGTIPLPPDRLLRTGPGHWLEAWLVGQSITTRTSVPFAGHPSAPPVDIAPSGLSGLFSPAAEVVLVPSKAAAWRDLGEVASASMPAWIRRVRERWEPTLSAPPTDPESTVGVILLTGLTDAVRARTSRLHVTSVADRLDRAIAETAARVAQSLRRQNVQVVQEMGERLYVEYPDNLGDEARLRLFWAKLNETLPAHLRAVMLRSFEALVSLAPRIMYAVSETSVIPLPRPHPFRSPEAFLRDYHSQATALILRREWNRLHQLTVETVRRIKGRAWHVADFCRRETLAASLAEYVRDRDARRRNPSAPYEALLRSQETALPNRDASNEEAPSKRSLHEAGSTVVYYIAGNRRDLSMADMSRLAELWDPAAPDENSEHYLERLRQSLERYQILFGEGDFSRIFGDEGLFSFADAEIAVVRKPFTSPKREGGPGNTSLGIWLDLSDGAT